jgi:hypothetical protein
MKPFLNKSFNAILKSLFDNFHKGIAKNRISLAPLSATQALLQDGKIPIPFSSNPIMEIIEQGL